MVVVCLPPCGGSGLKCQSAGTSAGVRLSPSVWREWIEMLYLMESEKLYLVSLRVEGVD